jgi:hypothetical protein
MTLALAAMLAVGACSQVSVSTAVPAPPTQATQTQATQTQATATRAEQTQAQSVVTPTPAGPKTYQIGEQVVLNQSGKPWVTILISDVQVVASYKGTYGSDTPKTAGDVFIQAKVTYAALADGVTYNEFDWQVFCAGTAVSGFAFVMYGPTPALSSGTLPSGRNASGYVVYEVPAAGEVRMSYGGTYGQAPVFEVIIRAS